MTFKDLHIGDTVILKTGKTGVILKLVSVPYINNFGVTNHVSDDKSISAVNFSYNETRDPYKIYNTVTVYLKAYGKIVNCDLDSIAKVLKDDSNYAINKKPNKIRDFLLSLLMKIKI